MTECANYGKYYWCAKVPKAISSAGEIYVMADTVNITTTGDIIFMGHGADKGHVFPVLMLAAGKWNAVYAASCIDGAAVAVEHWRGEVIR